MSKPVRLPDYLAAEVQRLADAENRSLANMVKVLLEQALKIDRSLSERQRADVKATVRVIPRKDAPTTQPSYAADHFKPDFKGEKR